MDDEASKIIDEILGNPDKKIDPDKPLEKGSLEETIAKLEEIASADFRDAYGKVKLDDGSEKVIQLPPTEWPDSLAMAVETATPNAHGVAIRIVAKGRVLESLARIKGAFNEADKELSPMDRLLSEIPREDLKALVEQLRFIATQAKL